MEREDYSRGEAALDEQFSAAEWDRLALSERIRRCRLMAREANELGRGARTDELKRIYADLAMQWEKLACEIERPAHPAN